MNALWQENGAMRMTVLKYFLTAMMVGIAIPIGIFAGLMMAHIIFAGVNIVWDKIKEWQKGWRK